MVCSLAARADEVQVAVAANFAAPMKRIAAAFEAQTGHKALLAFGATGKFYAQIKNGAPFEILLSADRATPTRLAKEGVAVGATQFTYAKGRLVLWSARAGVVDPEAAVLKQGGFDHLAIANPDLAPYGAAALQAIRALGLDGALAPSLVIAENVSQAYQFVKIGNAQLGLVAASQVMKDGKVTQGSAWLVPASLHQSIRQDAIVLAGGVGKPAVAALMKFLQGGPAQAVIMSFGYESGTGQPARASPAD